MTTCPPDHSHAEKSVCYHLHGCRCEPCKTTINAKRRRQTRERAYGQYRTGHRDPTGAQRRIQGLMFLGWRAEDIGEIAGIRAKDVRMVLVQKYVFGKTHDSIDRAYKVLIARGQGPSTITRKRAQARGWVSPLAWESIDTDEAPVEAKNPDRGEFDEIAVELAVSGQPVPLNLHEREEAIRRLHALRWPDPRIAKAVGVDKETVNRTRRRLGLPTWAYQDRATEYGQEHRETAA